jgi:hypothetical protein
VQPADGAAVQGGPGRAKRLELLAGLGQGPGHARGRALCFVWQLCFRPGLLLWQFPEADYQRLAAGKPRPDRCTAQEQEVIRAIGLLKLALLLIPAVGIAYTLLSRGGE